MTSFNHQLEIQREKTVAFLILLIEKLCNIGSWELLCECTLRLTCELLFPWWFLFPNPHCQKNIYILSNYLRITKKNLILLITSSLIPLF